MGKLLMKQSGKMIITGTFAVRKCHGISYQLAITDNR